VAIPIQVLVTDASRMLSDIVRRLVLADSSLVLVSESAERIDVLVRGDDGEMHSRAEDLMRLLTCETVVTIGGDGRTARFQTAHGTIGTSTELSPSALVAFIRLAADAGARDRHDRDAR
jgi:hypothetical protein